MKRIFSIIAVFLLGLFLVSCDDKEPSKDELTQILDTAEGSLGALFRDPKNVTAGFSLPTELADGVTAVWTSSEPGVVNIGTPSGGTVQAVVNRPTKGSGNATVTISVKLTITKDGETKDRNWSIEITILEQAVAEVSIETIADVLAIADNAYNPRDAKDRVSVTLTATVFALGSDAAFIYDGTGITYVYGGTIEWEVGKVYEINGKLQWYFGLWEITEPTATLVAGATPQLPEPEEITNIETYLDNLITDGQNSFAAKEAKDGNMEPIYARVTGFVYMIPEDTSNYNTYIVDSNYDRTKDWVPGSAEAPARGFMVYYQTNDFTKVREHAGFEVTMDVIIYTYRSNNQAFAIYYIGGADGIELGALTDEQVVELAVNSLAKKIDYNYFKNGTLDLPTTFTAKADQEATITWTSDKAAVINPTTGAVTVGAAEEVVKLEANVSYGSKSEKLTWNVVVAPLEVEDIEDVLAHDGVLKRTVMIKGIVTSNSGNNVYTIQDGTGAISIFARSYKDAEDKTQYDKFDVGFEYTLVGTWDAYNGLLQVRQTEVATKGEAKPLPEADVLTEANLKDEEYMLSVQSHLVTIDGDLEVTSFASDDYGNIDIVFKFGTATIALRYDSRVVISQGAKDVIENISEGDFVNITAIPLAWYKGPQLAFDHVDQIVVLEPETDEQAVNSALLALKVPDVVTEDIVLPTLGKFGSTIVWASSDAAVISNAGVVTLPDNNTSIVLTATVTKGEKTASKAFTVYVQVDETLVNVRLARKVDAGEEVKFDGVVSGVDASYVYVSDADNVTIVLYIPTRYEGIAVGDFVVVEGEIAHYNGLIQVAAGATLTKDGTATVPEAIVVDTIPEFEADDQGKRYSISDLLVVSVNGRTLVVTDRVKNFTVYVDPNEAAVVTHIAGAAGKKVDLVNIPLGWFNNPQFLVKAASNVVIKDLTADDKAFLDTQSIKVDLMIDEAGDMELPLKSDAYDLDITWTSSNTAIITNAGVVTLPAEGSVVVTLTASITEGSKTYTKEFEVKVYAEVVYTFHEKFEDAGIPAGNSYVGFNFNGVGGSTWTVVGGRDEGDYAIDGKGIMMRQVGDNGAITLTLADGLMDFEFQYRKAFTGGNKRQYKVDITNDGKTTTYTLPDFGEGSGAVEDIFTFKLLGLDLEGEVVVKVYVTAAAGSQATFDNFKWNDNK